MVFIGEADDLRGLVTRGPCRSAEPCPQLSELTEARELLVSSTCLQGSGQGLGFGSLHFGVNPCRGTATEGIGMSGSAVLLHLHNGNRLTGPGLQPPRPICGHFSNRKMWDAETVQGAT